MTTITYAELGSVEFEALPDASKAAVISRAVAHIFGNEVASRVHSKAIAAVKGDSKDDPSKEAVKAWKDSNPDQIGAWTTTMQAEKWAALLAGTLGVSASGPRLTPLATMARKIARQEVVGILAKANLKAPTGENTISLKGEAFTMSDLIDRRLAHETEGSRIEKEAQVEVNRQAKKAASIAANAPTELDL